MKAMIDSNIYDDLAANPIIWERVNELKASGTIEIITTHIQEDEIAKIPDNDKAVAIAKVRATKILTEGAVWGVSKWDEAKWGRDETNATIDALAAENPNHMQDALIGVTAASVADLFVTNDQRLASRLRASCPNLRVRGFADFVKIVSEMWEGRGDNRALE